MSASPAGTVPAPGAPLDAWLDWIGTLHPNEMELGLERVGRVAVRLGLSQPPLVVVTVGGTNGKGSTVAMLEAIWTAAGHRTGAATSPHVTRFNERVRVAGTEAADADLVRALARVEETRGGDSLTYFEFATLAAMVVFVEAGCDVAIMEVGLGGRLDAVNLWDADCAVLTSIALDHADWLGTDLDVIATEKAAIGRRGRPFVIGERTPPPALGRFVREQGFVSIDVGAREPESLPSTALAGPHQRRNAGCALAVVEALRGRLPVSDEVARDALAEVSLGARFERRDVRGTPLVLDVAHNPAGAAELATTWRERFDEQRAVCVFAALADKDIEGIVRALAPIVAHWCCAALDGARATPPETLATRVRDGLVAAPPELASGTRPDVVLETFAGVDEALAHALARASEHGLTVLVCGSFLTIAAANAALDG